MQKIGESFQRIDAYEKVTGSAKYPGDISMPGMLHIKLLYTDRTHAEILSIDTRKAETMEGVVRILTADDVPNNEWGITKQDREVLCSSIVRYVGDRIALVVAETPAQAQAAVEAIEVRYKDLPVLDDPLLAMESEAVLLHEDSPDNLVFSNQHEWGDVEKAFQEADVIIEREYHTPMQEHVFLEPEAGLGFFDEEGILTVICGGQSVHDDQYQIAHALNLPLESVRVIYGPIGGAFGGREEISIQILLALAAFEVDKPVKMVWDRKESIQGHCKRHAMTLRYKWSATRDGQINAAEIEIIADAGAYDCGSVSVMKNYIFSATGPYDIPNIKMDLKAVYTNNIPGGAFRGYGFPQITFASELQVSRLAQKIGVDPVTMRLLNCYREGSKLPTQSEVPQGVNLPELIQKCAVEIGMVKKADAWHSPHKNQGSSVIRRGIGIAAGMKSSGFSLGFPEGSEAKVILYGGKNIEKVEVFTAAADVGQGVHTALCQIAAETLDVALELIQMITSDTKIIGDSGPASASRLTLYAGNAVKFAALEALEKWKDEDRPARGYFHWKAPPTSELDHAKRGESSVNSIMYGVHGVEVKVDMETGKISIERVVAAHDPGVEVNPQQIQGQIDGGVVQALGWTLLEDFKTKKGEILTNNLSTYLIPTVMDIPETLVSIIDELPDPMGPYGVRGIGEITFIPLAPAIIGAVNDATGLWFDRIPVTPGYLLEMVSKHQV